MVLFYDCFLFSVNAQSLEVDQFFTSLLVVISVCRFASHFILLPGLKLALSLLCDIFFFQSLKSPLLLELCRFKYHHAFILLVSDY